MSTTIIIPDFPYSSHFYGEILEDLTLYLRTNCPELTDEDPAEPHMQLIRAFALSSHLNATLLDLVANEMFLPTATLRPSHVALLALIDVHLAQASPASTTLVAQLSQLFSTGTFPRTIAPAQSLFATVESKAAQSVEYETLSTVSVSTRTDQVGFVYTFAADTGIYTDQTAAARLSVGTFSIGWARTPGDALYIGHPDVLFNQIQINLQSGGTGITGSWEYFDGNYDQGQPTSVTNLGSTLQFNVTSILGALNRAGQIVRVRSAITGAFQDLTSTWTGTTNIITTGGTDPFLGQTSPSTNIADYIVGSAWRELTTTDGTNQLATAGTQTVSYSLPQNLNQEWSQTVVGIGSLAFSAYWIRFRIVAFTAGVNPVPIQVRTDTGKTYIAFPVTQGHTRSDNPLGSSDGTAGQTFTFTQFPVIDDENIVVTVVEATIPQVYTRVDNFLNSVPTDRHYTLVFDDDGAAVITFGDGTNGKIPTAGVNNISASYRTMDDIDGNVGANTITVNRSGVNFLSTLSNPRAASGYAIREGSTVEDLARLKVSGPASLRVRQRAVSTQDTEVMATEFKADDGSKPVARALAIEESFGPKTVEVVVVGQGGNPVDASKLSDVSDFFNGTDNNDGVIVLNHQAIVTNFTQHQITITMTLTDGNATSVVTALTALLNPLAKKSDGTYTWSFGGQVTRARLFQVIMDTSPPPTNCQISSPAADINLGTRELPVKGTITINGVAF